MILSNSGRIVVVDNKFDEVNSLLKAFANQGVPYIYTDGSLGYLPAEPLVGVRYVFLDIELNGMQGQNDKTKASGLMQVLEKIIDKNNGPYVILFWTTHEEVIGNVLKNCFKSGIAPVANINLQKKDFYKPDNDKSDVPILDVEALLERIESELSSVPAFQLINQWENAASTASVDFINTLTSYFETEGENWSEHISCIFHKLYKAYAGERECADTLSEFKHACYLINRSYFDTLESSIDKNLHLPEKFKLINGKIPPKVIAKINTTLLINYHGISEIPLGGVYSITNKDDLKKHITDHVFLKKLEQPSQSDIILCRIVITPECLFAQDKMLKGKKNDDTYCYYHRVIYALLWKASDPYDKKKEDSRQKRSDSIFTIGPIYHDESMYMLSCHFSSIDLCLSDELQQDSIFSLRREIFSDLKSKAASHVSRLGNSQITVPK